MSSRNRVLFLQTTAVALCASVSLANAQGPQLTAVEISDTGFMKLTHELGKGEREITLSLPIEGMDMFLGSAVLRGVGLGTPRLHFQGSGEGRDLQAGLVLDPEDIRSAPDLLGKLVGQTVSIGPFDHDIGRITSVEKNANCGEASCALLTYFSENTQEFRIIEINDDLRFSFPEGYVGTAITRMLDRERDGRSDLIRNIRVSLTGSADDSHGSISYLQKGAPWKMTYRYFLEESLPVLQAWAVIENTSPMPWDDVTLTLNTGSIQIIEQSLFGAPPPRRAGSMLRGRAAARDTEMFALSDMMAESATMSAAPAQIADQAVMQDGDVSSRYQLRETVSLDPGEMVMMPIFQESHENYQVSRYRGSSRNTSEVNPDIILTVKNDTDIRWPSGVIAASSDDQGHIGDASIPALIPGAEHQAVMGKDDRIEVSENIAVGSQRQRISITGGVIITLSSQTRRTGYEITSLSDQRGAQLLLQHPRNDENWKLDRVSGADLSDFETSERGYMDLTLDIAPDENKRIVIDETYETQRRYEFGSFSRRQVLDWIQGEPSEDVREALGEYAGLLSQIESVEREIQTEDQNISQLMASQQRQIQLMDQFQRSRPEYERFSAEVIRLEDEILSRQSNKDALNTRKETLEERARAFFMNLELVTF